MFQHFPLQKPVFEHQFGISALETDRLILFRDELYREQVGLRSECLSSRDSENYLQEDSLGNSVLQEFVRLIGKRSDVMQYNDGVVVDLLGGETVDLKSITLRWMGAKVQEDIVILADDASRGFPIVAGCVCFPSGWSIKEKLGQSILAVHREVPEFDQVLYPPTEKLFERMKVGRTVWRTNWGVRPSPQLDQSPCHAARLRRLAGGITAEDAGTKCFFRVEFQTLTRVASGNVVFTIKTEQCSLDRLSNSQQAHLKGVLETCPEETLQYKGIAPMKPALLRYLAAN